MRRASIFGLLAALTCAAQQGRYELANSKLLLALNSSGELIELTNRQTNHQYVAGSGSPVWRMYYRNGDSVSGALDLRIEPTRQNPTIRVDGSSITIVYNSLTGELPRRDQTRPLDIGLEIKVSLEDDQLVWRGTISNRESDPSIEITEFWLPWVQGIRDMGRGQASDVLYWPERAGRRIVNPYKTIPQTPGARSSGDRGEPALRLTYPFPASMQWYTFNDGDEGLYFGSHDQTLMTSTLNVTSHPDVGLSASIVKYPFVSAGETWTSEPAVMRLYRGSWHEAARTYRAWASTWMQKPDPPEWLRREPGWILPMMKGQTGHIYSIYADLPSTYRRAHDAGIDLLNVFGWVKQGFDNLYPEYDTDEALGGTQGLKDALAQVRQAGGRTILYTQGQLIDPAGEYYRKEGYKIVARDIWGYEYRETYGGVGQGTLLNVMRNKYFGIACPTAAGWLDHLKWQLALVQDLGAQGIIFDQMGGIPPYICFSKEHPHRKPSLAVGPGKVRNMRELRAAMKSRDPDFLFVMELATDCYAGFADIIHSHGIGFWPEPEAFGEMFRYTFPDPIVTNRGGGPLDRRAQLGHAFALGWRFDASLQDTRDANGEYFARLNTLRRAHPELLTGRFVDTEGFTSSNPRVSAHAFIDGDRLAITLWNPGENDENVNLAVPGYQLETADWQDPAWRGPAHSIQPRDIAVFIFRRNERAALQRVVP